MTGPVRTLPSPRLAAAALAFLLALLPLRAPAQEDPRIETSFAVALVRDTMTAVNHANWTGNYTVLRDYADRDFIAANDPTRLAALFAPLRSQRLDLMRTMILPPVFVKTALGPDGAQMQLTGYFALEPDHVSFDLLYREDAGRWWLLGASVGTFAPIEAVPPAPPPVSAPPVSAPSVPAPPVPAPPG